MLSEDIIKKLEVTNFFTDTETKIKKKIILCTYFFLKKICDVVFEFYTKIKYDV